MLVDAGCRYVILGHSERREHCHQSDEIIKKKILIALKNGLVPILCVGEVLADRQNGQYLNFIKKQISNCVPQNITIDKFIIAYEPIWAIGSGKIPEINEIREVTDFIKNEVKNNYRVLNLKVIYGGSTSSKNTKEIMSIDTVSGLLVGGASLNEEEFFQMSLLVAD